MGRLRVHSSESMQGKLFVGFVALILTSYIHNVMLAKDLYKRMSMQKMLKLLNRLKIQDIGDSRIIFPATKEQEEIFKVFGITTPKL